YCCSRRAEFPYIPTLESGGSRASWISGGSVAGQHSSPLLRVSHHGRPRFDLRRCLCARRLDYVSATPLSDSATIMGADAAGTLSLHSNHRGMDDGGAGTPAVASVWTDADGGGQLTASVGWERTVHAARVHGHVLGT